MLCLHRGLLKVPSGNIRRRQWHPTPVLLPGKSHGQRSLVGCSPWGRTESDTTEWLHFHFSLSCIGEANGNPLQCSCLENPKDNGAAIYGVAQSRTRLKKLSSSSSGNISHMSINYWQKRRKALAWVGTESGVYFILSISLAGSDWDWTFPGITPLFSFLPFLSSVSWSIFLVSYVQGVCCWGIQSQKTPWTFLSCFPPLLLLLLLFFFFFSSFIL